MFVRNGLFKSSGRAAILATVAEMTISAVVPTGAFAAPVVKSDTVQRVSPGQGVSDATDFSSQRRRHVRRGGNGNAAGLAAFGAIVGTIGAIAASQNRRDYYYDRGPGYYGHQGYYGGGHGYYGGGPAYYGGPGYY